MKLKKMNHILIPFIIMIGVGVFTFICTDSLFRHRLPWESSFEIGQCYEAKSKDPFDAELLRIKVVDIKSGYIQYYYIYDDGKFVMLHSARARLLSGVYRKIPCGAMAKEEYKKENENEI